MNDYNINTGEDTQGSTLPDLHNRRDNIKVVSDDCKANGYPLIVWPEDKELLRLTDLPRFVQANKRPTWTNLKALTCFVVSSDYHLRQSIREGLAYSINLSIQHLTTTYVIQTWQVTSR